MTEPIEPALILEEWMDFRIDVIDRDAVRARIPWIAYMPPGGIQQKVAAACLYNQPHGFTWEDVDRLREIVEANEYEVDAVFAPSDGPALLSLADRIAALLPPDPNRAREGP